jgi:hypothetical protein
MSVLAAGERLQDGDNGRNAHGASEERTGQEFRAALNQTGLDLGDVAVCMTPSWHDSRAAPNFYMAPNG